MRIPVIAGLIRRRILVKYRVDPGVIERLLPARFRPQLYRGHALAGICLIRLEQVRPNGLPALFGISSENAAHRVAVEWDDPAGRTQQGVYIARRDSDSLLNRLAGGRIFPGIHHSARFQIGEVGREIEVSVASRDGQVAVSLWGEPTDDLPDDSIFESRDSASAFFEAGALGYSPTANPVRFDGLTLKTERWQVQPLRVRQCRSSFFDDPARFPPGSVTLDHALLMRNVKHSWHHAPALSP